MKIKRYHLSSWVCLITIVGLALYTTSCKEDETVKGEPNSIFQYLPDEDNIQEISFVNFSKNAVSYEWDFGDGTTSTEVDPVHTYSEFGTYEVRLTAMNGSQSSTSMREVMLTDPNADKYILTGEDSKTWKLIRDNATDYYAYIQGSPDHSAVNWTFGVGGATPLSKRPCLANDEWIFSVDGTLVFDDKGDTFSEGGGRWPETIAWQCIDTMVPENMVGAEGADLSGWGSGTFSYTYSSATDKLTVNGLGAHIGFIGAGTEGSIYEPVATITYDVVKIVEGDVDTLVVEVNHPERYWQFVLVHYDDPSMEPPLSLPPPVASFTVEENGTEVSFSNTSQNATGHMWDFGDGNTSTEASPTHTYDVGGIYLITYTASNTEGNSTYYDLLIVGEVDPSAADLYGTDSKSWHMRNAQYGIWVGTSEAGYDIWANNQDWVNTSQCLFDDQFTLYADNSLTVDVGEEMLVEPGMGYPSRQCVVAGDMPDELQPWTGGEFDYTFTPATENDHATITVNGEGAYMGYWKPANGQEIYAPTVSSITYNVYGYIDGDTKEYLFLTIDVSSNASKYWLLMLEREK